MSVDVFETTLQKTHEWINKLAEELGWGNDDQRAYLALRGTLHALRDRLPVELSAKLSAQLPMLIRGFYYEGWKPAATPVKVKTPEEFIDFVTAHFKNLSLAHDNVEEIVRAVFKIISERVSAGEIDHIRMALPASIGDLWPNSEYNEKQRPRKRTAKQPTRRTRNDE